MKQHQRIGLNAALRMIQTPELTVLAADKMAEAPRIQTVTAEYLRFKYTQRRNVANFRQSGMHKNPSFSESEKISRVYSTWC